MEKIGSTCRQMGEEAGARKVDRKALLEDSLKWSVFCSLQQPPPKRVQPQLETSPPQVIMQEARGPTCASGREVCFMWKTCLIHVGNKGQRH